MSVTSPVVVDGRLEQAIQLVSRLRLPDGMTFGERFETDPWLLDRIFRPALARREDGRPEHRLLWLELTKGSLKSTALGALGLVEGMLVPRTHTFLIATDEGQGKLPLEALASIVDQNRRLQQVVKQTGTLFTLSNGSFVKVMSSDEKSFHGIGPTSARLRVYCDEVTQWFGRPLFDAALASLPKSPDGGQLLCMTNAGLTASWQEEAKARLEAAGAYMHVTPQGWLPSWQDREAVLSLRETMLLPLWERFYLNRWVSGVEGQPIGSEDWDSCRGEIPPLDSTTPVVVGVDAATSHDSFAITAVSRGPRSGPAPASELVPYTQHGFSLLVPAKVATPEVWVRAVKVWDPPGGGGKIDFGLPYHWLSDFVREHNVQCIVYDVWQLHDWAENFRREHRVWMEEFEQGPRRSQSDTDLIQLVRARRLRHDGDAELRSHVLNASLKLQVAEDSRARFIKSHPAKKIDALIGLSMSASQLLYLNLQ